MREGLISASIAAIVAALVSLPLQSPDDALLNSATVVIAVLLVGVAAGLVWRWLEVARNRPLYFAIALAVAFTVVAAAFVAVNTLLDRTVSYALPLAAIGFALTGVLTWTLARTPASRQSWATPAAVAVALAVGIGLAGYGDEQGGELSLPERVGSPSGAVAATAAPVATLAATAVVPTATGDAQAQSLVFVIGEGSEATFTVGEQLARLPLPNDAVVRTTALSGELYLDGRLSIIEIDLHSLSSDQAFRDRYIRSRMFPNSRVATFTVRDVGPVPAGLFGGSEIAKTVDGDLNIRDENVPLSFDVVARIDGEVLQVLGKTTFTWSDLGIAPPTAGPVVSVKDEVRVEVLLQAEPQRRNAG